MLGHYTCNVYCFVGNSPLCFLVGCVYDKVLAEKIMTF